MIPREIGHYIDISAPCKLSKYTKEHSFSRKLNRIGYRKRMLRYRSYTMSYETLAVEAGTIPDRPKEPLDPASIKVYSLPTKPGLGTLGILPLEFRLKVCGLLKKWQCHHFYPHEQNLESRQYRKSILPYLPTKQRTSNVNREYTRHGKKLLNLPLHVLQGRLLLFLRILHSRTLTGIASNQTRIRPALPLHKDIQLRLSIRIRSISTQTPESRM